MSFWEGPPFLPSPQSTSSPEFPTLPRVHQPGPEGLDPAPQAKQPATRYLSDHPATVGCFRSIIAQLLIVLSIVLLRGRPVIYLALPPQPWVALGRPFILTQGPEDGGRGLEAHLPPLFSSDIDSGKKSQ